MEPEQLFDKARESVDLFGLSLSMFSGILLASAVLSIAPGVSVWWVISGGAIAVLLHGARLAIRMSRAMRAMTEDTGA